MHAVLVNVTMEPEALPSVQARLRSEIVPQVTAAPGLVAAYWLAPVDGPGGFQARSVILFEDEESARAAARMAEEAPALDGVTIMSAEVIEVIAHVGALSAAG